MIILALLTLLQQPDLEFEFRLWKYPCGHNERIFDFDCDDRVCLRELACIQNNWECIITLDWPVSNDRLISTFARNMTGPERAKRLGKARRIHDKYKYKEVACE